MALLTFYSAGVGFDFLLSGGYSGKTVGVIVRSGAVGLGLERDFI